MKDLLEFYMQRAEALELEVKRLNDELNAVKVVVRNVKYSDPNFLKPLSEMNVNFEIVKPCQAR
jgi:hypothetical protein